MTNIEKFKSMTLDELVEWLDKNCAFDDSPWLKSFDKNYCSKCESIKIDYKEAEEKLGLDPIDPMFCNGNIECAFCEIYNKCRFFKEYKEAPNNKEMIRLWLNSNSEN